MRECIAAVPGEEGVDLRLTMANMLASQGKNDAAEKELLAAAALVPSNQAAQVEIVRGLLAADRPQPALPMIEKLADIMFV